MAKKRRILRKEINSKGTSSKRIKNNAKRLKVYKVNNSQKKKQSRIRREKSIQTFLIVLIIILAIAAVFSAIQTFLPDLFGRISLSGELAAKVNRVPITMQQLNTEYDRLPLQYKYLITKEAFLNQLINEALMIQEAESQGLSVSEGEVNESIKQFMQGNNITPNKLDDILKHKNLNYPEFRGLVKKQLLIDKLLESSVKSKINVTTEQALQYYNDNSNNFRIPELVTAKHILISVANRTQHEAEERANMVFNLILGNKSNFCDLVREYSDDSGSTDRCGQYTFPRGQMVKEFEDVAFSQGEDEISIVNTSFGYHILWTINKTPEQLIRFKDVQEQIKLILEKQQEKILLSNLIARLRENASIINYLEQREREVKEKKVNESAEEKAKQQAPVAGEETVKEEEAVEEAPEEEAEELPGETVKKEEEQVEEVEAVEEEEAIPMLSFVDCLTSQGAVLYGAYWDSSTKKQKAYFGEGVDKINYVECAVEGDYRAQQEVCREAGILAYPTWIINNEKYMGIMTPEQLSALTGCEK